MELVAAAVLFLVFVLFLIHDFLEISTLKYGLLKAMTMQSKDVERELQALLKIKGDAKILNGEFRKLEKIYLSRLNLYLMKTIGEDDSVARREILRKDKLEI